MSSSNVEQGPFSTSADGLYTYIDPPMPLNGDEEGPKFKAIGHAILLADGRRAIVGMTDDGKFYEIMP